MVEQVDLNIGLALDCGNAVAELLNVFLADEYLLYTKTRNYHWNVVGPHFVVVLVFWTQKGAFLR